MQITACNDGVSDSHLVLSLWTPVARCMSVHPLPTDRTVNMVEGRVPRLSRQSVEGALTQVIDTVVQAEIPTAPPGVLARSSLAVQLCHVSHIILIWFSWVLARSRPAIAASAWSEQVQFGWTHAATQTGAGVCDAHTIAMVISS